MNYSYLMGVNNVDKLKENNFTIINYEEDYGVIFSDEQVNIFEEYVYENLSKEYWTERISNKEKVFIFHFSNGEFKKYILDKNNEPTILKLCCEFADCEFESIDKMLSDNEFYRENFYN